ncbi:hypothetical protein J2S00_003397 [Caldalkalibacillus uzonensis]|uniref:Site-specific DNA-methyltransferase (cytosine-N(4)-specific) n=1 Tax=Caldalkalibacillus uzonensis TaxID=353224 RepID=A0ABU0CVX9_9BACI|nr:hypothetical protein [Caldalkalibacillus uzonensis]MDQ0340573.1 hypothetical protein [Caldalkalibacillus uzonensis]
MQYLLSPEREYEVMYTAKMNQIPDILAFFYVALFRTLRQFSRKFKSQNPTWLKKPKTPTERIKLQAVDLYTTFEQEVLHLLAALDLKHRRGQQIQKNTEVILDVATSEQLPITDNTVNLVLTSPPYCTRIDYAMLTPGA